MLCGASSPPAATSAGTDEIDKLPSLSKLDLFVKHLDSSKSIDRGAFAVQGVEELKGLRDHYVHPHVRKSEWKQQSEQERILDLGEALFSSPVRHRRFAQDRRGGLGVSSPCHVCSGGTWLVLTGWLGLLFDAR